MMSLFWFAYADYASGRKTSSLLFISVLYLTVF